MVAREKVISYILSIKADIYVDTPFGNEETDILDRALDCLENGDRSQLKRLERIEAAAIAIDGIEMRNCVEIPLSAWEDLQKALYPTKDENVCG